MMDSDWSDAMDGYEIRNRPTRSTGVTDWYSHTIAECIKKHECDELLMETMQDFGPYIRYYDIHSFELLDEKIAVMTALREGKRFDDIPDSKKILELMREDDSRYRVFTLGS